VSVKIRSVCNEFAVLNKTVSSTETRHIALKRNMAWKTRWVCSLVMAASTLILSCWCS